MRKVFYFLSDEKLNSLKKINDGTGLKWKSVVVIVARKHKGENAELIKISLAKN